MQIVSGKYRHRILETNPGLSTRPITVRVKVSLFDRLQPDLQDARIADIFAGTGTIGFEALSRGAKCVVFIENDRDAFSLLQRNVTSLKAEQETICWRTDASKCSFRPMRSEGFLPFDMIFFDPPYVHTSRMKRNTMLYRSLTRLAKPEISAPDAMLVLRCEKKTEFEVPSVWQLLERLDYSSMEVHLFQKRDAEEATPADEPASDSDVSSPDDDAVDSE